MTSNIPANPTYGVYISQLISRICDTFQSFIVLRHRLLTERLIKQGFRYSNYKLCKFFKKFVSRHNALFSKYAVSVRTHVHEEICIPLVVKHELSKHITTSIEVIVLNYILHNLYACCCTSAFCHFPEEDYVQGLLLCVCLLCE